MAYQVGFACFDSVGAAAHAIAAGQTGKVVPAGSVVYVVDAAASDASITYTLRDIAGATADVVSIQSLSIPPCELLTAGDAVSMGWGVLAAWIAAFALLSIRKGF